MRTLPQALAEAARVGAGYTFVPSGTRRMRHAAPTEAFRSYADLQVQALRVARSLREAGLRRGDLVALVLPDAEEFLTTLFGASMAGLCRRRCTRRAATTDLPRYFDLTINVLRASGARAVVTTAALSAHLEELRPTCPDLSLMLTRE